MARMVELEFLASFEKELEMPGDSVGKKKSDPNIFDVFLMESTLQRRGRRQVALCIAIKGRPGENSMMWYDGESFVPLHMWQHCRKLASLSGSARVLQALDENPDDPDLELMKCCMNRDGLITASEFDNSSVVHYDPSIAESMNKSQKQALNAIASPSFNKGFLAIQGPPGCGKTTTIIGMISAVGKNVIVTAPSNAAVANVALKLFETGRYNTHEIAVFGENCDESVHFLNPFWRCQRFQVFRRQLDAIADSHDLSDSSKTAERFQVCDAFAAFLRLGRLDLVDEDSIEVFLNKVNLLCPFVDKESDTGRKQFQKLLASSKVVFCTLNTSGSMFFKKALQGRFDTLMLDEGGQCSEAEFYIACTFPRLQRIIVVGDPKQLGATVIDHTCKKEGFGESWLDKIYKLYPQQIHLLDTQYRLDPKILLFPNHRFYRNRIKSGENVHDRSPKIEHPLRFVDASGRGREEREDYSWKNAYEAAMIKNILKNDYDVVNLLASDPFARIIIITPYRAQEKLLRETLDASVGITNIEVSTVDKVQGQERDIVVISTVRTKDVGFVDDGHRINVALTRAKRVLRVVGDVSFFKTLPVRSTLRALAEFCEQRGHIQKSDVRAIAWCPPDWKQSTLWKPTSTARFIHCLRAMSEAQRNVCLNTLFSVALPDLSALNAPDIKQRDRPTWIMSRLRGERVRLNIVWIAKRLHGGLCIQAHFAGDRDACLNFIQRSPELPDGACQVRKDLSGILEPIDDKKTTTTTRFVMSWPLTNELQTNLSTEAGLSRSLLAQGRLILDDTQERVARSTPPLLIESRSGTGKTLVLLQHAAFFARANRDSPACFVTVSPRLRDELYERYKEIGSVENPERENTMGLPPTQFYSFRRLLSELAEWRGMKIFSESENCSSFLEYCDARRSYKKVLIETGLIGNEIGGVIMGSLAAAKQRRPLDRDQYLADKRSNVSTKSEQGKQTKNAIYDEYKRYQAWKVKERKFDVADIVLSLLGEDLDQIFSSETKDFFSNHRSNKHLNNLVRACSESERRDLESLHPLLVGDYHFENGEFLVATRFFLFGDDKKKAELATVSWIKDATRPKYGESLPQEIDTVVGLWKEERAFVQREYPNSDLNTLLEIFLSEMSLAEISKSLKTKFSILFGRRFILHLVNYRSLSQLDLYHFGDSEFDTEIFAALQSIHCNCPVESIFFFINHNDKRKASDFALKVLKPLGESAVIRSLIELRMTPTRLFRESEVRKQLDAFVRISLDATSMGTRDREEFCQQYVSPEIRTGIIPTTVRYCLKSGHSELALDLSVRELAACGAGDAIWVASIVESWLRSDTWHSSLLDSRQVASPQPSATTKQITQSNGDAGRGKKNGRKQNKRNRKVREKAVQSSKENAHGSADDKRLNRRTNDMIRKDAQSWLLLLLREPCYQKSGEVVIRAKFGQGFGTFMHLHDFRKSDPVLLRSLLSLADDLNACLTSKFEEVISYPETVGAEGKNHPYSDFRLALSKKFGFAVAAHLECFQPSVGKAGNLSLSTLRRFYRDLKLRLRNRDGQALEMFKQELKASLSQHRRDDDNWHYRDARLSLLLVFPSAEADFLWWQQVQNDGHPNARSWSCIEFHQILKRFKTFHQELQTALRAQEEKILGDMVKERKEKKISLVKTLSQNQGATIEGKKPLDSMAKISKTPRQTKNPPSKDWFEDTCNVQAGDMSTVTRDAPSAASRRKRKKSKKKK